VNCYRVNWITLVAVLTTTLLLSAAAPVPAENPRPEMALAVGAKAPLFAVATSQGTLADYNRDYYGQHHLVLTFFPAAFTPV
jgi:hypothetical protein